MAQADADRQAQMALYAQRMAPEAQRLRWGVQAVEACIRKAVNAHAAVVPAACEYGTVAEPSDRRVAVPNRGRVYGGATHWVSLVYTPGDERRLDALH